MNRNLVLLLGIAVFAGCGSDYEWLPTIPPRGMEAEANPFPADALNTRDISIDAVRALPVQFGRRYGPFETYARVQVRNITGKNQYEGVEPSRVLLHWLANPGQAIEERAIRLPSRRTCEIYGLERSGPKLTHTSFLRLRTNENFLQNARAIREKRVEKIALTRHESELWAVWERYLQMGIITGYFEAREMGAANPLEPGFSRLPIFPPREDPQVQREYVYNSPGDLHHSGWEPEIRTEAGSRYRSLLAAYEAGDQKGFDEHAAGLESAIARMNPERDSNYASRDYLVREVALDRLDPFSKLKYAYFLAFFLGILSVAFRSQRVIWTLALLCLAGAAGFHTWALTERTTLAGRAMIGNLYESALFATLAAAALGAIAEIFYRTSWVGACSAFVAMLGLFWAQGNPGFWNPEISKLQPVLINNDLIHIHVPTMMVSYAILAIAVILAHTYLIRWWFSGSAGPPPKDSELDRIGRYMTRAIPFGVVILFAGIILGGVWADASWGRFWGWDPKETASLVTWIAFVVIIHGWWAGWLRHVGTALACLFGGLTLIWTYWGANFVQQGLHSYAGSGTDIPTWPYYYFGLQVFIAAVTAVLWFKRREPAADLCETAADTAP